jgi:hypothetical protein
MLDRKTLLATLAEIGGVAVLIDGRSLGILGGVLGCGRRGDLLEALRELRQQGMIELHADAGALPIAILTPRGLRSTQRAPLEVTHATLQ